MWESRTKRYIFIFFVLLLSAVAIHICETNGKSKEMKVIEAEKVQMVQGNLNSEKLENYCDMHANLEFYNMQKSERNKERQMKLRRSCKVVSVREAVQRDGDKIAFLTFDDGPSPNTEKILDILKQHNVKATFFVIGQCASGHPDTLRRTVREGHSIGNHTYSHNLSYGSKFPPSAFIDELKKNDENLKRILGKDFHTNLIRFPGGSFGHDSYKSKVTDAGYSYLDWNATNGDTSAICPSKESILSTFKREAGSGKYQHLVVLMHDAGAKKTTVEALPEIIEFLKSNGYEFGVVSQEN